MRGGLDSTDLEQVYPIWIEILLSILWLTPPSDNKDCFCGLPLSGNRPLSKIGEEALAHGWLIDGARGGGVLHTSDTIDLKIDTM